MRRGQGFKDGREDMRLFGRAVLEGRVGAGRSLLLGAAAGKPRLRASGRSGGRLRAGAFDTLTSTP
ncbi:hypothetical protein [Candidatus Palauibacter sp.]|uniref:hypothetical protein n=1 Tax=Candidatus Palauibacter sp. TaxID=3101350 RepID=UPI003AF245AA